MEEEVAEEDRAAAVAAVKVAAAVRDKAVEEVGDRVDKGKAEWVVLLLPVPVAIAFAKNADIRNPTREESHACKRNAQVVG
jgi:hypothetical protein